jgi:hypothetical protein
MHLAASLSRFFQNEDTPTTNVVGVELRGILPDRSNLKSLVAVQDDYIVYIDSIGCQDA